MHLERENIVYLHVPKTAGNAIQTALLPYSDDSKICHKHQDGRDRFGIKGAVTPRKHARIHEYLKTSISLEKLRVAISIRHPFTRTISAYFSPHRWLTKLDTLAANPEALWDEVEFVELYSKIEFEPAANFLINNNKIQDVHHIIRYEQLTPSFHHFVSCYPRLANSHLALEKLNATPVDRSFTNKILCSKELQNQVSEAHKVDYEVFGYDKEPT